MKKSAALILVGFLSIAFFPAFAGAQWTPNGPLADYESKTELAPTDWGVELDAWGVATKGRKNGIEELAVRVVANAEDGALFTVTIETATAKYDVGAIRMKLSSGVLVLTSSVNPSEAFPVSRIRGVLVSYKGKTVVEGRFPDRELGG